MSAMLPAKRSLQYGKILIRTTSINRLQKATASFGMSASGKVALVTGAAQGLGKAFCEILLKNGAKVGITDYNVDQGQKTLSEFEAKYGQNNVMFMKCDVTSDAEMKETFEGVKERMGGLDIVINNAGIGGEMEGMWEKTVDVNLKGMIRGTNLALKHMRKDKGGKGGVIVNVSSMAALNPNPCGPVYAATKSAILMFSQSWSKNPELAANGVRINVLCPSMADTALMGVLTDSNTIHVPHIAKMVVDKVGVMSPETVADAMFELVDDQNKTGAVLKVSEIAGKEYHAL